MTIQPTAQTDFYKTGHAPMYPIGTTKIYSNLTPRKSRHSGIREVVVFGIQYFVMEYLIEQWNKNFFQSWIDRDNKELCDIWRTKTIAKYKRLMDHTLGKDSVSMEHFEKLHDLGYLPLEIKALPEGSLCPIGVPCMTITNTVDHAYWLVNYLETILSCTVWQPMTSATIAHQYRKLLTKYAIETTGSADFVQWQAHDFSMRGMSSLESACTSGAGHLLSFTGTDTVPAIEFLERYYLADVENDLVGASVPATEHSVMCMGLKDGEVKTFERLLDLFPKGILSVVSDTWDLWNVVKRGGICEQLRDKILGREGKLVIRPDSGDPVDIICGYDILDLSNDKYCMTRESGYDIQEVMADILEEEVRGNTPHGECGEYNPINIYKFKGKYYRIKLEIEWNRYDKQYYYIDGRSISKFEEIEATSAMKGVVECLWDIFGGIVTPEGYKVLDSHIGAIYGDSITLERADQICARLKAKGFASTNIVFGVGSFTYQMNTRDTFGFAMKATYGIVMEPYTCEEWSECIHGAENCMSTCGENCQNPQMLPIGREIFKDPITDSGEKKSARGLLRVDYNEQGEITLYQQQTKEQEKQGLLQTIFLDGKLVKQYSLREIRERLSKAK